MRRKRAFSLVILIALAVLSTKSYPQTTVIDFEDLTTGGHGEGGQVAVFQQYSNKGITFNDPAALDYSKGAAPWRYQGFAHSGTRAIEQCYGKEFCSTPIVITFTAPQKRVKVWVGYATDLTKSRTVILSAYNAAGAEVKQITATFQPSTTPIPVKTSLEVISDSANINSAKVSFAPDAYGMVSNNNLAVDDVEFDTAGPAPPCPSAPKPSVTLGQPTSGQIFRANAFNLQGTVATTNPLQTAMLLITGPGGSHSFDLLSTGIIPHAGGAFSAAGMTDMLFIGSNTLTVSAKDCNASGESSTTVTFQPCDATTRPVVTISEPVAPAQKTISTDSFTLKGAIVSPAGLQTVTVTISGGVTYTESHQFPINPDNQGAFNVQLSSDNLFRGNNTITVTAQSTNGCSGEASTTVVFERMIKRRISGVSYIVFAQGDPQDKYAADNGFLHVSHNPGCGVSGNNGNDKFFVPQHDLPFWATLENVEFRQFWPKERKPDSCGVGGWFGGGSYLTKLDHIDKPHFKLAKDPRVTVHWENACCGRYSGMNIEYVISFIVSVPEGLLEAGQSLGESMFDPNQTPLSLVQPPSGFNFYEQPPPVTAEPTGPGKLNITLAFDTIGTQPFSVTAVAQGAIVSKKGTGGETTFTNTTTKQVSAPGIANISLAVDNLMRGTWNVSLRSTETGVVGGYTCQAYVPGSVMFNFSGGTGLKCVTSTF